MRRIKVEFIVSHDDEDHEPFLESLAHAAGSILDAHERYLVLADSAGDGIQTESIRKATGDGR